MSEGDAESVARQDFIGFPPPLLGERPLRLPVVACADGLLVLEKPSGVIPERNQWYPRAPSLADALQYQLEQGKPELARVGLQKGQGIAAVVQHEPDIPGLALLSYGAEARERYREAYGSYHFELAFQFLTRARGEEDTLEIDLPIAKHRTQPRALISHTTGKKAQTRFTRLMRFGRYTWWEARTRYYRMDQIPLHAVEAGLPIVGEMTYGREQPVFLSQLKRGYRQKPGAVEQPLHPHMCLWLASVTLQESEDTPLRQWQAALPKSLQPLQKQLQLRAG